MRNQRHNIKALSIKRKAGDDEKKADAHSRTPQCLCAAGTELPWRSA